jgi:hypothetical protein
MLIELNSSRESDPDAYRVPVHLLLAV